MAFWKSIDAWDIRKLDATTSCATGNVVGYRDTSNASCLIYAICTTLVDGYDYYCVWIGVILSKDIIVVCREFGT